MAQFFASFKWCIDGAIQESAPSTFHAEYIYIYRLVKQRNAALTSIMRSHEAFGVGIGDSPCFIQKSGDPQAIKWGYSPTTSF